MTFGSYEVGVIQRTPVPQVSESDRITLSELARRAWSLKQRLDSRNETSHAFLLPPGLNERCTGSDPQVIEDEIRALEDEIDDLVFALYGIDPGDRAAVEASVKRPAVTLPQDDEGDDGTDDDELVGADSPTAAPAETTLTWLVGVVFGRFDERLAIGERPIPTQPEPFDPLPSRSPGMWPEAESRLIDAPDILVDDPGHDDDIQIRVANAASGVGLPDTEDLRAVLGTWIGVGGMSAAAEGRSVDPAAIAMESVLVRGGDGRLWHGPAPRRVADRRGGEDAGRR